MLFRALFEHSDKVYMEPSWSCVLVIVCQQLSMGVGNFLIIEELLEKLHRFKIAIIFFSRRTVIAGAIIGFLLVFAIQRIWIVLGRCLFDSKRLYGFFWSERARKSEVQRKNKVWKSCFSEEIWRAGKRENGSSVHTFFWKTEKCRCADVFAKRANFLFTCCIFKLFFETSVVQKLIFD